MFNFTVGGSIGTVQHEYFYNTPANGWRVRNRTDGATWSAWGNVVMTDGNQGLLTGLVITSNYSGTVSGLSIGGTAATATTTTGNAGSVTYLPGRTDAAAYPVLWGATYTNEVGTIAYSCAAVTIQSSTGTLSATTFTGALNGNAATVTNGVYTTGAQSIGGVKSFTSTMNVTGVKETMTTVAAATNVAINLNLGTIFKLTFSSTVSTFTITNTDNTNVAAGNSFTLISAPDNSNAKTLAFSFITNGVTAAVKWPTFSGGTTPTATITSGKFDVFSFVYDGVNWYGFTGGLTY
jgi:hypothetical protein